MLAEILACVSLMSGSMQAPSFTLRAIDGTTCSLDSLLERGPVVINFWATWCKHCSEEMDMLNELYSELQGNGVTVLGISVDGPRSVSKVKPMAQSRKWNLPILLDTKGEIKAKYRVLALPTLFVVDRTGKVVYTRMGYSPSLKEKIRELLMELTGAEETGDTLLPETEGEER